jgi:hypothetical protein
MPPEFFEPAVLTALRDYFTLFGAVHSWAPIRAFNRTILVYYSEDAAESAKTQCDNLKLDISPGSDPVVLRVFRAEPTTISPPTTGPEGTYLCPPEISKNFLISPPGSPPVGWEQVHEDPPNSTPLADDLIAALRELQLRDRRTPGGPELVLDSSDDAGDGPGIAVYVEDCDERGEQMREVDESEWVYGETNPVRTAWRAPVTARPPMTIGA